MGFMKRFDSTLRLMNTEKVMSLKPDLLNAPFVGRNSDFFNAIKISFLLFE